MNVRWSLRGAVVIILFAWLGAMPAEAQTYGGSATGAAVTVPATGTVIRAATGTLSISGGGAEASLLVGDIPGSATGGVVSLAAGTLHSSIVGLDATRAEASMGNVALTVSGNQVTADFIMARATTSCGPAASGSSELGNLVINSQVITVTGNPNQTVSLPNGTAIINEQSSVIGATSAEMVVNALHITTRDTITGQELADVVLANVEPQINCQGGSQPDATFGTGGGWVMGNQGGHANFGVVGGVEQDGTYKAHVVYEDHDADIKVKSIEITSVDNTTVACETTITGIAEFNGISGIGFTVRITDHGEPGRNRDRFRIDVAGYFNVDEILDGGNIQKHRETCTQ